MFKLIARNSIFGCSMFLMALHAQAAEKSATFESSMKRTHLLEVYTSQGCSSCPPAEAWLNSLAGNKGVMKNFIPLAFHVDYWDNLGWKDVFSQAQFTQRQREVARSWGRGSIYTPGAVLDGKEWTDWGQNAALNLPTENVGVLKAVQINGRSEFKVQFSPDKTLLGNVWTLHGALVGNGLKTQVLKGENRNKLLQHNFVVFDIADTKMLAEGNTFVAQLAFSKVVDSQATSKSAVFWVTKASEVKAVQAVGGNFVLSQEAMKMSQNKLSKEEKLKVLSPLQRDVTQNGATEMPFHNKYWSNHASGIYVDVISGEALFSSLDKFDSGTGWPSFTRPIDSGSILQKTDHELLGMERTELKSKEGGSHLGHVFDDGPQKSGGKRYCINSASLNFVPLEEMEAKGYGKYLGLFKKMLSKN